MSSAAALILAVSTDRWTLVTVDREGIGREVGPEALPDLREDYRYSDRSRGLFRVCFPLQEWQEEGEREGERRLSVVGSSESGLRLSWAEEWCRDIDYQVGLLVPHKVTAHAEAWYHVARSSVAAFVLYFACMAVGCTMGLRVSKEKELKVQYIRTVQSQ